MHYLSKFFNPKVWDVYYTWELYNYLFLPATWLIIFSTEGSKVTPIDETKVFYAITENELFIILFFPKWAYFCQKLVFVWTNSYNCSKYRINFVF